jgi:hypothetical protein
MSKFDWEEVLSDILEGLEKMDELTLDLAIERLKRKYPNIRHKGKTVFPRHCWHRMEIFCAYIENGWLDIYVCLRCGYAKVIMKENFLGDLCDGVLQETTNLKQEQDNAPEKLVHR